MKFKTLVKICYGLAFQFDFNNENKKIMFKKTAPTDNPNRIGLIQICF